MEPSVIEESVKEDLLIATFLLGEECVFGVDASLIQEVIMVGELRPVRHAPAYVAGIRNLRGRIITIIDLSVRLGLGTVMIGPETRILIANWKGEPVGLLVDEVADAIEIPPADLESPPPNLNGVQMQKLLGVFRYGQRLAAYLNLSAVLGPDDKAATLLAEEE